MDFTNQPAVMAIVNVTPDSFSDGGCYTTVEKAVVRQLWPWQDAILVEFRLSGVTGPTDVNITLNNQCRAISGSFKCNSLEYNLSGNLFSYNN